MVDLVFSTQGMNVYDSRQCASAERSVIKLLVVT